MRFASIDQQISVSPQIFPEDLPDIAQLGFRSVICNRPDGEAADQPTFEEIEIAAKKLGLEIRYQPITAGMVSDDDAQDFGNHLNALPKPILAYCRSGTRCATLWALSQAGTLPVAVILSKTKAAGYDMAGVVRRIANDESTPTKSTQVVKGVLP